MLLAENEASTPASRPAAAATPWVDCALVFLVFFIAGGDPAPHRNEAHYLARLKHYWNPDWCAGDLFLESPDAHFTVVWLLGWMTLFLPLGAVAWVGRIASWALLSWAWTRLSHRVTPSRWVAPLTASLLVVLTEQTHLAGEWVIGGFEAKTLAYGLVLAALRDALDNRWNRAWIVLGFASALHALVGGWSVIALLYVWVVDRRRPPLAAMAPGLALGGAIALLGVAPALMLNRGVDGETVSEAHQIYVFTRLPHHLSPLGMPLGWLTDRVARFLVGLAIFALLTRWLLGRRSPVPADSRGPLSRLAAFAVGSLAIAATGYAIEIACRNHPAHAASVLRYYLFRLADVAPAIASATMLGAAINAGVAARRAFAVPTIAACLAASVWGVGGYLPQRVASPHPPADVKMRDKAAWREMCEWVGQNTEADSVFLVPRLSHTFKWFAERPEVVTYKDVPQNAAALVEWRRRFDDVFTLGEWPDGSPRWTASLAGLGAQRLRELAEVYGADYALDEAPSWAVNRRASLPIVHRVGPYSLYDLRP